MVNRSLLILGALGVVATSATWYATRQPPAPQVAAPPLAPSDARAPSHELAHSASAVVAPAAILERAPDPEVARLEARRQLYETVDALVQASEFEKARRLLDEDQSRYGDDLAAEWRDMEQSYRIIADCLERPSPTLRVRAQAFSLVSQARGLKSRISSACSLASR